MNKKFEVSQNLFESWKDSQRDENGSFGCCLAETETNHRFRIEIWNTIKFGMRLYQIYENGNGFQEWECCKTE